ncbi:MAG: hypothetical protein JO301_11350, partial [Chitinophagaceae bacterium]|nr:hypothetical protein [Chitinophagaceae bacterium]
MKTALLRTIGCIGLIAILFSTIANTTILRSGLPGDLPSDKSQADATYNHAGSVSRTEAEIGAAAPVVLGPVFSSCPGNISVNNDAGTCGAVVNYTAPAASEPARDTTITIPYSKNAIDSFKVPNNVTSLTIRAVGAAGGNRGATLGGKPASIQGVFAVTPGQKLYYLIGQKGGAFTPTTGGAGGGGGTFVTTDASFSSGLLLAAAGGGGVSLNATNAAAVIDGNSGLAANSGAKPNTNYAPGDGGGATSPAQAAIGVNGSKGNKGGAGGAGWTANGEDADTSLGAGTGGIRPFAAAANNGVPGGVPAAISNNGVGGYGGGGSGSNAGGGGGGFNGGGGGSKSSISSTSGSYGGGGGSYNGGTSQLNQKGSETTDVTASTNGFITIKWTINPVVTVTQTAG